MKSILIAFLGVLLTGCASPAPVPGDKFYRFADPQIIATHLESPVVERLAVAEPRATGLYAERAMVYSTDEGHRRLGQYHYDFWLDAPPRLLQRHMIAYFRNAGVASQIVRQGVALTAHHLVSGHIDCFEQHLGDASPSVAVCLELRLKQPGNGAPILNKSYEAKVSVRGDGMEAVVRAYERALDQILEAFVRDITRIVG